MTSLPPIDRDTALRLLEKQVEEAGPDYVYMAPESQYQTCQYVADAQPSCLIARALADYGVPLETLASWDDPVRVIDVVFRELTPGFLTEESAAIFAEAQWAQDISDTWGQALNAARVLAETLSRVGS